jgi:CRISPR-associated endonuclease/helicase Cas3
MSEPILAKPRGDPPVTLEAHTARVASKAKELLEARGGFAAQKYRRMTGGDDLRAQVFRAVEWHDVGKRHPIWQKACRKDWKAWKETGSTDGHLRTPPYLRHEFASLLKAEREDADLTFPERAAIAAHHGKLSFNHEHRWFEDAKKEHQQKGPFVKFWEPFAGLGRLASNSDPNQLRKTLMERYRVAGVRALLQLADKRASREEDGGWLPPVEPFTYDFPYDAARGVQEKVKEHWDEPAMILRAPTGSGKTDAAMLWAQHQVDEGRADRLAIAMPTRFTSNALAVDVSKNVGDTGLYHSSAWYTGLREEAEQGDLKIDNARELHRMARLLMTPVTVSTIDHLLIALTGTREDHHSIFFNLTNACVVIDEADFYDAFVQANLLKLLRVLRLFEVPVLIMSATVPESAKTLYGIEHLVEDKTDDEKTRCYIHEGGAAEKPDEVAPVLEKALEPDEPAAIIYANTVSRALDYYDWFCDRGVRPILYHSRFTEPDKKRVEEKLISALGREAWKKETASGIAVLTQIGEMSLNISAPLMVSDLCPHDRLAQRAGRLGRFDGMEVGDLYVVTPQKDSELYPAPYGEYLRDEKRWQPGRPLLETKEAMQYGAYSARDFVNVVNELYPEAEEPDARAEQNRKRLHQHLCDDWLIVPAGTDPAEDDIETDEWRSRDIPPQRTVLTQRPRAFDSYAKYRAFELECGVSCSNWQIQFGIEKLGRATILTFCIGDEEVEMPYSPCYSESEGLILDKDRGRPTHDRCL